MEKIVKSLQLNLLNYNTIIIIVIYPISSKFGLKMTTKTI